MAEIVEVRIPDIGDFDNVTVVEVLVAAGDRVEVDQDLITLESDKASMGVPSSHAGTVKELKVAVGDEVGPQAVILTLEPDAGAAEAPVAAAPSAEAPAPPTEAAPAPPPPPSPAPPAPPHADKVDASTQDRVSIQDSVHAGPAVRRLARELSVDLTKVHGSGRKGRIVKKDIEAYIKSVMSGERSAPSGVGGAFALPPMPDIDFSKFGPVEEKPLHRIRQVSAKNVHRSWLHVPHVTQHEEVDITDMDAFRKAHAEEAKQRGFKLTPVAFLLKAAAATLKAFPEVNASLGRDGDTLILKKYVHIGVAVDTPNGLVVPVIRDVDQKGLFALAEELLDVSGRAREGRLLPKDFQGAGFTISSLGGIGGSFFTPIVNAPELAILGVSRSVMKPVWNGIEFVPRLMLPLSLSYDHRVIDGAQAARFIVHYSTLLGDLRRLLL